MLSSRYGQLVVSDDSLGPGGRTGAGLVEATAFGGDRGRWHNGGQQPEVSVVLFLLFIHRRLPLLPSPLIPPPCIPFLPFGPLHHFISTSNPTVVGGPLLLNFVKKFQLVYPAHTVRPLPLPEVNLRRQLLLLLCRRSMDNFVYKSAKISAASQKAHLSNPTLWLAKGV